MSSAGLDEVQRIVAQEDVVRPVEEDVALLLLPLIDRDDARDQPAIIEFDCQLTGELPAVEEAAACEH
ncbi:MAG: hypothetical protein AW07_01797 [Candidatus Accumulibacter sp. SK-11]|nr:MAG: hypothetical protein AW07_01797 [Candidatus Accumulibacter sp. SK-11]